MRNSNIRNVYLNIKVRNGFLPFINNFTIIQKLALIIFLLIKSLLTIHEFQSVRFTNKKKCIS